MIAALVIVGLGLLAGILLEALPTIALEFARLASALVPKDLADSFDPHADVAEAIEAISPGEETRFSVLRLAAGALFVAIPKLVAMELFVSLKVRLITRRRTAIAVKGLFRWDDAVTGSVAEILNFDERSVDQNATDLGVSESESDMWTIPLRDSLGATLDLLQIQFDQNEPLAGLATGYTDLDEQISGLQPSNLIVVGARPAMGKTAFALGMVAHAGVKLEKPVLLVSLEMGHLELTQRLLCSEARVDANRMRTGRLRESDWTKLGNAISRMADAPIYIEDNPNLTVLDILASAKRIQSREGLGLIVIDYLQLVSGGRHCESRQVEVSEVSRGLKIMARELDVPVVALSEVSRDLESRLDKRPKLGDLSESGSIEQDADAVLFLYRDEVYNPDAEETLGTAEVIVAKHRNGPTGVSRVAFIGQQTRFDNLART